MQFYIMMQTSFDANLVRTERSDAGVARALALFDHEKFFAYLESGNLCTSNYASNLMIAFSHHCDKTLSLDTAQKSIILFRLLPS